MKTPIVVLRWMGNISALICFWLMFAIVYGETWPHVREEGFSYYLKVPSLIFWLIYLIALPIGWRWRAVGGGLSLLAVLGWIVKNTLAAGHWGIRGQFWIVLLIPGVLLLAGWILEKLSTGKSSAFDEENQISK
jgi:hypothetical protein